MGSPAWRARTHKPGRSARRLSLRISSRSDLGLGHVLGTATRILRPQTAYSRTSSPPHPRSRTFSVPAGQVGLTGIAREWGGWGSNPRPTDYESSPPAALVRVADLGIRGLASCCTGRFWHVLGMIKPCMLRILHARYVRKVPHRGTVRTRPSAARLRSTRVIVDWETW